MVKINTSVLIGSVIYPAGTDLPDELADQVDADEVFAEPREPKTKKDKSKKADKPSGDTSPAAEFPEGDPVVDWTAKQLDAYAVSKGFDISAAKNKQEQVDAIAAAAADAPAGDN